MKDSEIERVLEKIAYDLNISDAQYEAAQNKYAQMAKHIDKSTADKKIILYPQGSFALGTIIRPIEKEDEYDLDFVFEYNNYNSSASNLKFETQSILQNYGKCKINEKRRCWQVTYDDNPQFHMDIIPAIAQEKFINITNKIDDGSYEYIGSNPRAYIDWFKKKQEASFQRIREELRFQTKVEEIKEYKIKTTLQKAIQILKRHRDMMFIDDINNCKPISIIITTMAANIYNHETRIVDVLINFLNEAEEYLRTSLNKNNEYVIKNPTYTGGETENFADKWVEHPERKEAFFKWLRQAKKDFNLESLKMLNNVDLAKHFKTILGEKTIIRVFNSIAEETRSGIEGNKLKVDTTTGMISDAGNMTIKSTHHYGTISK